MCRILFFLALLCAAGASLAQTAQSPAFTYQGQLRQNGAPVDGTRNLAFALFNSANGGNAVGTTINAPAWPIVDGLFTIDLNFPGAFTGAQRWLEVRVDGVPMLPRQPVMAAPVAQYALSGNTGPQGPQGTTGPQGPTGPQGQLPSVSCAEGDAIRAIGANGTVTCHTAGLREWSRQSVDFTMPNLLYGTIWVSCPPGHVVLGGGVEQLQRTALGNPAIFELRIIESFPTLVNGRWAWQLGIYNLGANAELRGFAVCAAQ